MDFSVLISVYNQENPDFLESALCSIEQQIKLPKEIVLVKDGPLTFELDDIIMQHTASSVVDYTVITLEKNVGLGKALNHGLTQCKYDWIARMDTDDIALAHRFERQFSYLSKNRKVDILGSWICEFDDDPDVCTREKKVPELHQEIVKFSKYRNPLNHMTVVFRKSAVIDTGGYLPMNGFEDYYLWMRMLIDGKKFANVPEVLVKARTGREMISRRQGWKYAKDELALEKEAYHIGFWSVFDIVKNVFIRVLPRVLPVFIVEKLYTLLRKI